MPRKGGVGFQASQRRLVRLPLAKKCKNLQIKFDTSDRATATFSRIYRLLKMSDELP